MLVVLEEKDQEKVEENCARRLTCIAPAFLSDYGWLTPEHPILLLRIVILHLPSVLNPIVVLEVSR